MNSRKPRGAGTAPGIVPRERRSLGSRTSTNTTPGSFASEMASPTEREGTEALACSSICFRALAMLAASGSWAPGYRTRHPCHTQGAIPPRGVPK